MKLEDIKTVTVHWSESEYINDTLGCDDDGDIEKEVDVFAFDSIIKHASKLVGPGYDKTSLTIVFNDDSYFSNVKFYLIESRDSLIKLIN